MCTGLDFHDIRKLVEDINRWLGRGKYITDIVVTDSGPFAATITVTFDGLGNGSGE